MKGSTAHPTPIEWNDCTQCVSPTELAELVAWDSDGGSPVFIRYNYEITGEALIFRAPGGMQSAPPPWTLQYLFLLHSAPFLAATCNDLLSIKSSPWWAFFPSAFHTLSWVFLLWLFRHCHCLGVLYTVPGGQSAANLFGGIMRYQLLYGCWRDCNGINGSTRLVSLPHCIVDANVKETLFHSVRCQGSVSTDGERCIASCGFLGSMGAVWSWPVHHRWLYMFTEELMTQLKLNGR